MVFRRSVFFKMFINLTFVLAVFSLIVIGGTQLVLANEQTNRTVDVLDQTMRQAEIILSETSDNAEIAPRVNQLARVSDTIIYIYRNSGEKTTVANTAGAEFDFGLLSVIEHVRYVNGAEVSRERGEIDGVNVYYMLCKKSVDNLTVEVRQNTKSTAGFLQSTTKITRWFVIVALGVSLVWALVFSGWFTKPITEMNKVTREIAKLDFSNKVEARSHDEIGELAGSINEMSAKLSAALTELNEKNRLLTKELERERSLDYMRKKFVSDVSHELKTPLSIIQGYAEALELQAGKYGDKCAKYSHAIIDETHRMNKLVHDLLNLSNYQSGNYVLKRVDCQIDELIEGIIEKFDAAHESKGIDIKKYVTPYTVNIDPDRIQQVIINLLSNAVSHADENKKVSVNGSVSRDGYRVSVYNSGAHIPADDIEKLWTPFYRGDDSRKRDQGRYGVGLSIVKALLELHHADFGVQNLEGGVEFYFEIKNVPAEAEQAKEEKSAPHEADGAGLDTADDAETERDDSDPFPEYKE